MTCINGENLNKQLAITKNIIFFKNSHKRFFNCFSADFFYFLKNKNHFYQCGISDGQIFTGIYNIAYYGSLLWNIAQ